MGGGERKRGAIERPVRPMIARAVKELPHSPGRISYEVKLDGWRCIAFRSGDGRVYLQSRQQRELTRYFPDVAAAVAEQLDGDLVLDGELVVVNPDGRFDFAALQRRIGGGARAVREAPACLVVFDVLAHDGDVRGNPYWARRARLEQLLAGVRPPLALVPMTTEIAGARAWLTQHADAVEGVVAKDMRHGYRPGKRSWMKFRARRTAEAVVGGVIGPMTAPRALLLGRLDARGHLRVAGRTIPLPRAASAELSAVLSPARGGHPWPATIPSGRVGLPGGDPVTYTPVRPEVVVELSVDTAQEWGRWRHGVVYQRLRLDLRAEDLTR